MNASHKYLPCHLYLVASLFLVCACPGFAQNTVVTYQGRVTAIGTNFSGNGQFKAALVTETNLHHTATATANPPSGGFITIINVTFGGNGYVSPPLVTITGGGGAGATATASLSGGAVTSITVNNPGSGYSSAPTVTIAPPPENLNFTTYWSNDGTSSAGSEPTGAVSALVASGLFTLRLGDPTLANMTALPEGLFQQDNLRVRLWFNNGVSGFAALSPTQPLTAAPYASYAAAARGVTAESNQPVQLTINGSPVLRITSGPDGIVNSLGGHAANIISNGVEGGFIGGGGSTFFPNRVGGSYATVVGGLGNTASGHYSTAMGAVSHAGGWASTAMGQGAMASGYASTAMGENTTASGWASTAMGQGATASGDTSTAMGYYAQANHPGSFVWADTASYTLFASSAAHQFLLRASGGVGINTTNPAGVLHVYSTNNTATLRIQSAGTPGAGRLEFVSDPQGSPNEWRPGYIQSTDNGGFTGGLGFFVNGTGAGSKFGSAEVMRVVNGAVGIGTATPVSALQVVGTVTATAFNPPSDRNLKENFAPVSPREVLDKVASLPISRWNFKGDEATPHVGPMAQDFHAAFGLGTDERHIATVDADGVALAAIQGLNQKLETENAELKARLAKLERLVESLAAKE